MTAACCSGYPPSDSSNMGKRAHACEYGVAGCAGSMLLSLAQNLHTIVPPCAYSVCHLVLCSGSSCTYGCCRFCCSSPGVAHTVLEEYCAIHSHVHADSSLCAYGLMDFICCLVLCLGCRCRLLLAAHIVSDTLHQSCASLSRTCPCSCAC